MRSLWRRCSCDARLGLPIFGAWVFGKSCVGWVVPYVRVAECCAAVMTRKEFRLKFPEFVKLRVRVMLIYFYFDVVVWILGIGMLGRIWVVSSTVVIIIVSAIMCSYLQIVQIITNTIIMVMVVIMPVISYSYPNRL